MSPRACPREDPQYVCAVEEGLGFEQGYHDERDDDRQQDQQQGREEGVEHDSGAGAGRLGVLHRDEEYEADFEYARHYKQRRDHQDLRVDAEECNLGPKRDRQLEYD